MVITRRTFLRTGLAAGIGAGVGTGAYGVAYERHHVTLTRATLEIRTPLAPELETAAPLRIGLLSDLHYGRLVPQELIARAVALLMAEKPDVIALLGDYVTWSDRRYIGGCVEALSGVSAPHGVFGVIGNHDDERMMGRAFRRLGIEMLLDAHTSRTIRGANIGIAGVRYWTKKAADIRRFSSSPKPTVLLAHDPRRLTEAAALGIPAVFAGHTHGGQIVLPGISALATRKFPTDHGIARLGSSALFVSRGVGTVFVPIRLNCPPEAAVITLRATDTEGGRR